MANILIAEDEAAMVEIIADYMRRGGHACFAARDGAEALAILSAGPMDLMILDMMMPHLDGFSVIMLTAKGAEEDKLRGYDYGADDYMTKPFSPKVLLAKVNALLRRAAGDPGETVSAGKLLLQPRSRRVCLDGRELALTHKEYGLLALFMTHPDQVFSREQLLCRVWGYDFEGATRTVDTHVKTLRQKLGDEGGRIVTLIRSGYKFEVTP